MNLLLTLPYTVKDAPLLSKCLAWMHELRPQGYQPHSCLLVADEAVPYSERLALREAARPMFSFTEAILVKVPQESQRWPQAPNLMFASAARQIAECYRLPWLWFEPDATPLVPDWLDTIAEAYARCPKRFMGTHIPSDSQPDMPPVHLAGCAVYDALAYLPMLQFTATDRAWDIAAAGYTVPRSMHFAGMQHYWGSHNLSPHFKADPNPLDPQNTLGLDFLKSTSVMFHRCKDGSLIDLLRQKAQSHPVSVTSKSKKSVPRTHVSHAVSP